MTKFISKVEEIYVFRKEVFKLDDEILRDLRIKKGALLVRHWNLKRLKILEGMFAS